MIVHGIYYGISDLIVEDDAIDVICEYDNPCYIAVVLYDNDGKMLTCSMKEGISSSKQPIAERFTFTQKQLIDAAQVKALLLSDTFKPLSANQTVSQK